MKRNVSDVFFCLSSNGCSTLFYFNIYFTTDFKWVNLCKGDTIFFVANFA